jgi:hypothetical protein
VAEQTATNTVPCPKMSENVRRRKKRLNYGGMAKSEDGGGDMRPEIEIGWPVCKQHAGKGFH